MWNQGGYSDGYGDTGGGYLNNTNFGSSQDTPTQKQGSRQRVETVMPCSVAQIVKAEQVEDKFTIDGITLHQVTLVGLIRSAKETTSALSYEVDDMTGPLIEVRQFVDNDENTPVSERKALIRENMYIRAIGHVRGFSGKKVLAAFRIIPVTDVNELTSHLLEVIYAHAYLTKKPSMDNKPSTSYDGNSAGTMMRSGFDSSTSYGGGGGQVDIGLTSQQQQVLNVIRSSMDEQGMAMSVVCERLKGMPLKVVRDAVEFLSSEGHIYSTIDDDHYKATDSM